MDDRPSLPTVEELRRRSADFSEKAKHAKLLEPRKAFEELAEMYAEMARSVEQLKTIQAQMREHK